MAKVVMNEMEMNRALTRLAYEIIERNRGVENIILVGIETRGVPIAKRLAAKLEQLEEAVIVESLDIRPYRDDIKSSYQAPADASDFSGKKIILVDDVLYTGRSIRAAMDACIDRGRPSEIALAVLIDRGHRELPIRPDYIGKNIPTSKSERVSVHVKELDQVDQVIIH
ncbi:bifunctional pyr operon transcriptional regulator/uracil phosphoribosyltransferase PyrR [Aerococcaceae bacterium DSM 109653]|uniref:Bifunctional protein PyrR n=1 Tax=Fundicoccus ignavus TaxID=2664442 RepID=A0A6I2GZA1_9LACT|nr:bifunctional pyr operon transcriptional regulator/uracil phosphoribosyltransferase PyrR [Fundicoccus ignavus]MRI82023.1 bifunctional pyr operon transcriptional regulator/uracil phosphoribosyltransferase PyrR [Fundicoccus ignavus]MRI85763.1 bifunctional pyr operon transcriptional regulator/uracil phosphoribosyltransferase PyrR [Fundicoccus ignavus]